MARSSDEIFSQMRNQLAAVGMPFLVDQLTSVLEAVAQEMAEQELIIDNLVTAMSVMGARVSDLDAKVNPIVKVPSGRMAVKGTVSGKMLPRKWNGVRWGEKTILAELPPEQVEYFEADDLRDVEEQAATRRQKKKLARKIKAPWRMDDE